MLIYTKVTFHKKVWFIWGEFIFVVIAFWNGRVRINENKLLCEYKQNLNKQLSWNSRNWATSLNDPREPIQEQQVTILDSNKLSCLWLLINLKTRQLPNTRLLRSCCYWTMGIVQCVWRSSRGRPAFQGLSYLICPKTPWTYLGIQQPWLIGENYTASMGWESEGRVLLTLFLCSLLHTPWSILE